MLEENELLNGQLLSEDNINADIFGEDVLTGSLIASGDIVASMVSEKGDKGDAATIAIGTTTTGEPGTQAIVTNSGTSSDAIFNFTIPKGNKGDTGNAATIAVGAVTTGDAGTSATITNSGTSSAAVFDFTIPKGDKGDTGSTGAAATISIGTVTTGQPGSDATVTNSGTSSAAVFNFSIPRGYDGQGSGDMLKSTYDTDNNGIVDNAEKVNNHTVDKNVPSTAVFTDENAVWGNITGTLSNQTDLKNALDKKQDLTPTRLTDTSVGTYSNPYILDTMAAGYYYIETPSGSSTRYFKLTSSATGSTSVSNSAAGDGFGFYLYIPETIDTPNLSNGDVVCYFDRISISSAGSSSGGLLCYVYDLSKTAKIAINFTKSYNRSFGTTVTASAQTWKGIKTFNDVPVCASAPANNSDLANKKYIDDGLSAKQDTLVSGTSIKTINGTSVLGSGNIDAGASIPIQNTAPLNPEEDDLWIDTGNDNQLKYYNGSNWEDVNSQITGDTLPIGSIIPYGNSNAPANWLVCDGSTYSVDDYPQLYAIIGNTYGGDALQGTFAVPNLKGRVAVGQDTSQTEFDTMGETGGSKYLQEHRHRVFASYGTGSSNVDALRFQTGQAGGQYYDYGYGYNVFVENTGTGQSGNLQPYQVVCYIIKAFQSAGNISQVNNTNSNSNVDTYSCSYVNDLHEAQYCVATTNTASTISSNFQVLINTINSSNGNFTISENGIRIGAGIHHVRVSAGIFIDNWPGGTNYAWARIYMGGYAKSGAIIEQNAGYVSCSVPITILPVQEGDIIKLVCDAPIGQGTIRTDASNTWLCVEKID